MGIPIEIIISIAIMPVF